METTTSATTGTSPLASLVSLVPIEWVKTHEEFIGTRVDEVCEEIRGWGEYRHPMLVDRKTGTILDGHHRHQTGLRLKLQYLPAILLDYLNDHRVEVVAWRPPASLEIPADCDDGDMIVIMERLMRMKINEGVANNSEAGAETPSLLKSDDSPTGSVFSADTKEGSERSLSDADSTTKSEGTPGVDISKDGLEVSKKEVLRRAISGTHYPPKTSRHILKEQLQTIPEVRVPLNLLEQSRGDSPFPYYTPEDIEA